MSYESDCNDYAVNGNPMMDHYDYEENARYDRFDGWADPDPCDFGPDETDGPEYAAALAWMENEVRKENEERAARAAREDDPDSPDYVPF